MNAFHREVLKTENTEKLHPGWQLPGEVKQARCLKEAESMLLAGAFQPHVSNTRLDNFLWDLPWWKATFKSKIAPAKTTCPFILYSAFKRKKILPFVTWLNLEGITFSEMGYTLFSGSPRAMALNLPNARTL